MVKESDQFDWVTAYLDSHGLLTPWRRITFVFIAAFAVQPLILLGARPDLSIRWLER